MSPRSGFLLLLSALLAAGGTAAFFASPGPETRAEIDLPPDAPLAGYRVELLDAAFRAASAFPEVPHLKNRGRAQEEVVRASLDLGQLRSAIDRTTQMAPDWRRGLAYAEVAHALAREGHGHAVPRFVELARDAYERPRAEHFQDWQRDRIRVAIAKTYRALGLTDEAAPYEADVVDSEAREPMIARALSAGAADYHSQATGLGDLAANGNLEQKRSALETLARLFDRDFSVKERREAAEERIKEHRRKLPVDLAVDLTATLAEAAIRHGDRETALDLVEDTLALIEETRLRLESRLPLVARASLLRFRAGEEDAALATLDAARWEFDAGCESIVDVFRAGALRPLAECYAKMGRERDALETYRRAVADGAKNVHSRPRANDLVATCVSMALHGVEPDEALRERIREICAGLGDPW